MTQSSDEYYDDLLKDNCGLGNDFVDANFDKFPQKSTLLLYLERNKSLNIFHQLKDRLSIDDWANIAIDLEQNGRLDLFLQFKTCFSDDDRKDIAVCLWRNGKLDTIQELQYHSFLRSNIEYAVAANYDFNELNKK